MSNRDRRLIRYGVACGAVVAGGLFAAALTNSLGNTVATVLIGGGLLAIVVMLLRDMGLTDTSARTRPEQQSRNGSDPHREPTSTEDPRPADPPHSARRTANVRRPDRMRGQRRRLH